MSFVSNLAAFVAAYWYLIVPLALAVAALTWLLPRPRGRSVAWGAGSGLAAFILGGAWLFQSGGASTAEGILFYTFSGLAVLGGSFMIVQRNPARAAISFALVIISVSVLFLLQAAPFLMAATIIIYAGAIIVTFLFVLMLAHQVGFSDADDRSREPFLAALAGFILLGALLVGLQRTFPEPKRLATMLERVDQARSQSTFDDMRRSLGDSTDLLDGLRAEARRRVGSSSSAKLENGLIDVEAALGTQPPARDDLRLALDAVCEAGRSIEQEERPKALPAANVTALGRALFTDYLLAVELGGTLLLIATVGAIAITARHREKPT